MTAPPGPLPASGDPVPVVVGDVHGSPGLSRSFLTTMVASGGTIVLTLASGVLTARLLGTEGRGQVAAITSWALTLSWATAIGFADGMTYQRSKRVAPDTAILATTLLSIPVLGLLSIVVAQLLVPAGFSAQSEETRSLARIVLCGIPFVLGFNTVMALLAGHQRFRALALLRLAQPALFTGSLAVLAVVDAFAVQTVLASFLGSYGVVVAVACVHLLWRIGWARPSASLARRALAFGLRLQGVAFGQLITTRLDLMLLPAFVVSAQLGYYSVAVSVASMVAVLFGSLSSVVFPVATGLAQRDSGAVVEQALRLTLLGGTAAVLLLGSMAPFLVTWVYGDEFSSAVPALRLLLPGIVLWSASSVLGSGLQASNRPGRASLVQLVGVVITVVGLLLALPVWGIRGAALTSTVAYATTFLLSLLALRGRGVSLRSALARPAVAADVRWLAERLPAVWRGLQERRAR